MFGVGRDLCGSSSPTPLLKQGHLDPRLHRTLSRWVLNISREGDSTSSLGSLGQGSVTLRGKKFFFMFSWNFLCFSLCPLPLVLSLGTTGKSLPALPAARGGTVLARGGCAGSGTHLRRAGRGFRNCCQGGGSNDDPLLAKKDLMIIYKLAMRGPGAFHISKEPLERAG